MSDGIQILTKFVMTPQNVVRRISAKNKKVLFKTGAYVRTTMQRSMRYTSKRNEHSEPGKPPLAHRQHPLLRKLISFAVDLVAGSVVIGPKKFGSGETVPELLDKGGSYRPNKKQIKQNYKLGGVGPIREGDSPRSFAYAKLKTSAQVDRAISLAVGENQLRTKNAAIKIAPRPFVTPVFSDGKKKLRELMATIKA